MNFALTVTSREFPLSPAMEKEISRRAEKLEKFTPKIISIDVVIESPHRGKTKGNPYKVGLDIAIPGIDLVVNKQTDHDLYVAIGKAFNAAKRLLEDNNQKKQRQVKNHAEPETAKVTTIFPTEEYGFLETSDGREIYFHKSSVVDDQFSKMDIGTKVRYNATLGQEGPRATTVSII